MLALLALGLNLIFGVLDIVWIAYVDLVAVCMYGVYFLVTLYGWPLWAAGLAAVGLGGLLGIAVHLLIISPILTSPPVNQLLATGGLLFFLQSFMTFLWTTDHRSIHLTLPVIQQSAYVHAPAATALAASITDAVKLPGRIAVDQRMSFNASASAMYRSPSFTGMTTLTLWRSLI